MLCPRSLLLSLFYFFTPFPFLLSSLFVPLLAQCRPSLPAYLSPSAYLGPIIRGPPRWAGFRRRLLGPWSAAWTRGGVGLNCQLKLSYVFFFVRVWLRRRRQAQLPTCQRDVHRCGRVWTVCAVVEPWSSCCQLSLAMVCVLAWLPGGPVLKVVKTHWCANDAWVKRVSSKKTMCGTWFSLFSLPVKELEFNQIGSTDRENGEVFKSGSTGILIQSMRPLW